MRKNRRCGKKYLSGFQFYIALLFLLAGCFVCFPRLSVWFTIYVYNLPAKIKILFLWRLFFRGPDGLRHKAHGAATALPCNKIKYCCNAAMAVRPPKKCHWYVKLTKHKTGINKKKKLNRKPEKPKNWKTWPNPEHGLPRGLGLKDQKYGDIQNQPDVAQIFKDICGNLASSRCQSSAASFHLFVFA